MSVGILIDLILFMGNAALGSVFFWFGDGIMCRKYMVHRGQKVESYILTVLK